VLHNVPVLPIVNPVLDTGLYFLPGILPISQLLYMGRTTDAAAQQ
jgi:hypothetical protein